jgi:hypothetical protein
LAVSVCKGSVLCANLFDKIFLGFGILFFFHGISVPLKLLSYFSEIRWIWLGHTFTVLHLWEVGFDLLE